MTLLKDGRRGVSNRRLQDHSTSMSTAAAAIAVSKQEGDLVLKMVVLNRVRSRFYH